jgi:c-di-GMP-binding flagellar brake protein YcgR
MVMEAKEKRRFPRLKLNTPLRYQVRGAPKFDNALSDDISVGGISFVNQEFIPPETLVGLEIGILSKILSPVGKIIWSSPLPHSNRYRTGIEFLELDPQQKNFLSDYINLRMGG